MPKARNLLAEAVEAVRSRRVQTFSEAAAGLDRVMEEAEEGQPLNLTAAQFLAAWKADVAH